MLFFDGATSALDTGTADSTTGAFGSLVLLETIVIVTLQQYSLWESDHMIELREGSQMSEKGF